MVTLLENSYNGNSMSVFRISQYQCLSAQMYFRELEAKRSFEYLNYNLYICERYVVNKSK